MSMNELNVQFNAVILMKSLERHEADTTSMLYDVIEGNMSYKRLGVRLIEYDIHNADGFREVIAELTRQAFEENLKPLINVDCHGDLNDGLEFANGSEIEWNELADCLTSLNIASGFNLIAIFSACFGAHFVGSMNVINPAPCAFILAPTDEIDSGEILSGLRVFYTHIFDTLNLAQAVARVQEQTTQYGAWYGEFAGDWYRQVIRSYIKNACTKQACKERTKEIHKALKTLGKAHRNSMSELKHNLIRLNRENLSIKFFNIYFMTDALPQNNVRFASIRQELENEIAELKATGKYLL